MTVMVNAVKKIGIIGAGFSGTTLLAHLAKHTTKPLEIYLFDKTGIFGGGDAYLTPFPHHFLNVPIHSMSAFPAEPEHFHDWLIANSIPADSILGEEAESFAPRMHYRKYLSDLLKALHDHPLIALTLVPSAIAIIKKTEQIYTLTCTQGIKFKVNQIVFALGNNAVNTLPFPLTNTALIANPWDYKGIANVDCKANVLIVGTGLSMVDAVLTLKQREHEGKIYGLSRHGHLPNSRGPAQKINLPPLAQTLQKLVSQIRQLTSTLPWRDVILSLRPHVQSIWQRFTTKEKKQFLRHVVSYWNIFRHCVPEPIGLILQQLQKEKQLVLLAGRGKAIEDGKLTLQLKGELALTELEVDMVVNCLGPKLSWRQNLPSLLQNLLQDGDIKLDSLQLGFATDNNGAIKNKLGRPSTTLFSLGAPTKGVFWECTSVPDIREHVARLAAHLLK